MVDEVMKFITEADPEVGEAIEAEAARQRRNLELIASENIVSEPVMMAMGSVLTNKYAEGYPGKRYYGGCQCVDVVESIAIERAKKLFGCDYANVQPHSGAQANMAVFIAMLKPGDTVMGMNLDHGGHLTHGSPVNFSGLYFNIVPYGVDDNGVIDYEEVERIALEAKPKLIIAGASAYAREIDFKRFREIADKVGAYLMEELKVPDYKANVCVAFARGNIGRAKLLASSEDFDRVKEEAVTLLKYIHELETAEIVAAIKKINEFKLDVTDYLDLISIWYRDVLLFKATNDANHLIFREEIKYIRREADRTSYEGLEKILDAVEKAKQRLLANVNFDLTMQLMCMTIQEN